MYRVTIAFDLYARSDEEAQEILGTTFTPDPHETGDVHIKLEKKDDEE